MSGINVPVDELRTLMGKSIIDSLSNDSKEKILAAGLEYVLEKPEIQERYSSVKKYGDSPIEVAFKDAMRNIIMEVARELAQQHRPAIVDTMQGILNDIETLDSNDHAVRYRLMNALLEEAAAAKRIRESD